MNFDNADYLGSSVLILTTLLGAYYLTLRIQEHFSVKPDPKLTYATRTDVEALRERLEDVADDCRADRDASEQRLRDALGDVHQLIRKNAEHIAALIANNQSTTQRLNEVVTRVDRLM